MTNVDSAAHKADDLVSVTFRRVSNDHKLGLTLVDKEGRVLVTEIEKDGIFYGSELNVGDEVKSVNGRRFRNAELEAGNRFKSQIRKSQAKSGQPRTIVLDEYDDWEGNITLVIKKGDRKAMKGVRSLPPAQRRRRKRQGEIRAGKTYRGIVKRNLDGSFNCLEGHESWKVENTEDIEEEIIKAIKESVKQDTGITLKQIDNKIFVSAIAGDSIFLDSDPELEIGDRIVEVNGMSFHDYGDCKYAMKVINKATGVLTLLVERGHDGYMDAVLGSDSDEAEISDEGGRYNSSMSKRAGGLKAGSSTTFDYAADDESVDISISDDEDEIYAQIMSAEA